MAAVDPLVDRAIAAAGGLDRWDRASYLEASFDAGGALFRLKSRPVQKNTTVRVATSGQTVALDLDPDGKRIGILQGRDVAIAVDGAVTERRRDARSAFRWSLRRAVHWDDLDFTYFAAAAMWTYLASPFVWMRPEIEIAAGPRHEENGRMWDTVDVSFPPGVATHCPQQRFYLDTGGHVRRHDYTAEVVSKWARAAHLVDEYRSFDGLALPTRRRVYPRLGRRRPLGRPLLVTIDIHAARFVSGRSLMDDLGLGSGLGG